MSRKHGSAKADGIGDLHTRITSHIEESIAVKRQVLQALPATIAAVAEKMAAALRAGGKILFCGNGGSAADAQHLAAEFVVRFRSSFPRPALPALALTVDTSVLTAAGNDFGFQQIFSRQVEALGKRGDLLVATSTSGNSPNVIEAVKTAADRGIFVVAFLGGNGGKLAGMADIAVTIPSTVTARIQECHIMIGHILCEIVEEMLFS